MMRKGASLIWAMVVSTAILFISVTTATFVIKESRMSIRMDDSSRAYAAAESGIEWGKYCLNLPPISRPAVCDPTTLSSVPRALGTYNIGSSQYSVSAYKDGDIYLESLGTSGGVNRKLEYIVSPDKALDTPDLSKDIIVTGSYVQQFDYWAQKDNSGGSKIGISNPDGTEAIYFEYTSGKIYLTAEGLNDGGVPKRSSGSVDLSMAGITLSQDYAIRVRIEYSKDLSAKMTIAKLNFSGVGPGVICVSPIMVLDLQSIGINYANFSKFYYSGSPVVNTVEGDGSVYEFISGDAINKVYFDNMRTSGISIAPNKLTVSKAGSGGGMVTSTPAPAINCGSTCAVSYPENTVVTLTAAPSSGSYFAGWSGVCSGTSTCSITMNGSKNVTATFSPNTNALTVTKSGGGTGTVTSTSVLPASSDLINCGSDCSGSYPVGTQVILTATAGATSSFGGWSGACSGLASTCTVTMDGVKSVGANFGLVYYNLTASSTAGGTVSGATGSYLKGSIASLTAVTYGGYNFIGWSDCSTGTANPLFVTMTSNKNCVANFSIITIPIYRFWNASLTDHLYTTQRYPDEFYIGWGYEGVAFSGPSGSLAGAVPIYRYWNTTIKDHHYTQFRDDVYYSAIGYGYEGVAFYGFPGSTPGIVTVYRYWNGTDHFFITHSWGVAGYSYEGPAWYGM